MKTKIIVIVGPTAVGKTALAIEVAKRFGGEVVSGDSQQVYRGLDIGTAKASPEEQKAAFIEENRKKAARRRVSR